jgi:antitoxin component YwqK of YwqJK toxin-antitoxin module
MKYILLISAILFVGCNSTPEKTDTPNKQTNTPLWVPDKDSCAIAKKYENAQFAESLVQPDYTGELNNYFGNDKTKLDYKHVYKNGKLEKSTFYYENQQIQEEYSFACGAMHGLQKWYYEDGKLAKVIPYSYGYRNGVGELFDKSGQLIQRVTFQNDCMIGEVQTFKKPGDTATRTPSSK